MILLLLVVAGLLFASPAQAQNPPNVYYNDFEFADMRFCNRQADTTCLNQAGENGMIILPAGEQPNAPAGVCHGTNGSGVCSGFDTFENNTAGHIINDPANCHGGSWCARFDITAGTFPGGLLFHSGYWRLPPAQGSGDATQACTGHHTGCITTDLYYRVWLRFSSTFQLAPGNPNVAACHGKLMYVRDFSDPTGFNTLILGFDYGTSSGQNMHVYLNDYGVNVGDISINPADNRWHSYEVHFNGTTTFGEYWIDDVLKFSGTIKPTNVSAQIATVDDNTWGLYINQNAGADMCISPTTSSFWVDDMAVSTTRIGGGGSTLNPPGTPSNLTVQ